MPVKTVAVNLVLLAAALAGCAGEGGGMTVAASGPSSSGRPTSESNAPLATPLPGEPVGPTRLSAVAAPDESSTVAVITRFVRATEDGKGLIVGVEYPDLCQDLLGAYVEESQSAVRVVAVATRQSGVCPQRLLVGEFEVALNEPLGQRTVTTT